MPDPGGPEERLALALRRAERAEAEAEAALQWAAWSEAQRERVRAERDDARAALDLARAERDTARAGLQAQLAALEAFQSSASWRLTAPVREFATRHPRLHGALHRARPAPPPAPEESQPPAPPVPPAAAEAAVPDELPESPAAAPAALPPRTEGVDIIICVHNALAVFRHCIASVVRHTRPPFRVILVDDGSDAETGHFIDAAAAEHGFHLIRHEAALGYTRAANAGLAASDAPWIVFLNSDTVVTPGWLDRMWAHTVGRPEIGVIGPLSNTASWQSVPRLFTDGDWAQNPLPPGLGPDDMAAIVARASRGALPLPFLNGFCYMVRRALLDAIGPFDEAGFGAGYGEENDFSIRARRAGWALVVATDAYVQHAQSSSYSTERRLKLARAGDAALERKHDKALHIIPQVAYCRDNLPMHAVRARVAAGLRRRDLIAEGRERWAGKRVAFVMPGGQGVPEGAALALMGVEVEILADAERLRPAWDRYDAVIATSAEGGDWLRAEGDKTCRLALYVREEDALGADAQAPWVTLLASNGWVEREILARTGRYAALVGPSPDLDPFAPAEARALAGADAPVRIAVLLSSTGSARAVAVLEGIVGQSHALRIDAFGVPDAELAERGLSRPWMANRGKPQGDDLARLLGASHILADLSDCQPSEATALAAMASGCVVVGPQRGALGQFVRHGQNGVLVDTADEAACVAELARLVGSAKLRTPLQINAIHDAHRFVPERAALRLLRALFD